MVGLRLPSQNRARATKADVSEPVADSKSTWTSTGSSSRISWRPLPDEVRASARESRRCSNDTLHPLAGIGKTGITGIDHGAVVSAVQEPCRIEFLCRNGQNNNVHSSIAERGSWCRVC